MGKTYSIPGPGMWPDPGWGKAQSNPNPNPHAHNHVSASANRAGMSLNADALSIEGVGNIREAFLDLKAKVDLLMAAIELAHQKGDDGFCIVGCWSCRIEEIMQGIKVARKIGGEEG